MSRNIPTFDMYLNRVVRHIFSDVKQSKYNPKVYYMTEFVRLSPMGEESPAYKEFKIGQYEDGYHGYYRAYIFIPSYWKFSSFSAKEMPEVIDIYGDKIIYKRISGPEGTTLEKHNCIGWSYDHGLADESLIGKDTVCRDISHTIKDILKWEWENEPEMMTRSAVNSVYESLEGLKMELVNNLSEENRALVDELFKDMHGMTETGTK